MSVHPPINPSPIKINYANLANLCKSVHATDARSSYWEKWKKGGKWIIMLIHAKIHIALWSHLVSHHPEPYSGWDLSCTLNNWGRVKLPTLSKIFKKDATKLKFTPQVGDHKKFQKMSEKLFLIEYWLMTSAIFGNFLAIYRQIRGWFQNFVTNYSKMIS